MKILNKKGISITEIIVSLALISLILIFVLRMLVDIRYEEGLVKNNGENLINQALVVKNIQEDLLKYNLLSITGNRTSINLNFKNSITRNINITSNTITYNNERTIYNNATIKTNQITITNQKCGNDSMIIIKIPIIDSRDNHYDIETLYITNETITISNSVVQTYNIC